MQCNRTVCEPPEYSGLVLVTKYRTFRLQCNFILDHTFPFQRLQTRTAYCIFILSRPTAHRALVYPGAGAPQNTQTAIHCMARRDDRASLNYLIRSAIAGGVAGGIVCP